MICENIGINGNHLTFAGVDTVALAEKHGTPLYLFDEDRIRNNCRIYLDAMKKHFGESSFPCYASKAASFKRIYEIMKAEGMGIDLVSPGEIYTAVKAGFPMENSLFHGNNKTDADVAYAMECGVGYFVADSIYELDAIARCKKDGTKQKVILRLTPGIDPHTYDAVATGKVDSKFGTAIETGQAEELVKKALTNDSIEIVGYHCHVGSQVFDSEGDVYLQAATIMLSFGAKMQRDYGVEFKLLNLGGGFGVRYTEDDPYLDVDSAIGKLGAHVKRVCEDLGINVPQIIMEPGRSIVADAGMTLYSVGTVKEITGYKNYVSIDGGMTDNPRYALYGSKYTVLLANRMNEECDFVADVAGRCCESGDIIQPDVKMPKPRRNDIIAVCTTGAYNYSMASNYNRIPRPPIVMLSGGEDRIAVKRESYEDLVKNDL
ncbi:MAG: diaminopimelate decarboxylase [Clostridia bacterium]|nr:diaminopimelate decarboxylase [Clostridia bacterium]